MNRTITIRGRVARRLALSSIVILVAGTATATDFKITVTDPDQLAALAAERVRPVPLACRSASSAVCRDSAGATPAKTDQEQLQRMVDQVLGQLARETAVRSLEAARAKCLDTGDCADARRINQP